VYLNADILPGPGCRGSPATCDAREFLRICLKYKPVPILSLGFNCHVARTYNFKGSYMEEDVEAMVTLCEEFELVDEAGGIVFALNLRIARYDLEVLKGLLDRVEGCQILFWTGTGEPSVLKEIMEEVEEELKEYEGRIAFDCKIAETRFEGYKNEFLIKLINGVNKIRGLGL